MFSNRKTFIEKLREKLANPAIKDKIQRNENARIFDGLPKDFDSIFSDADADAAELGRILKSIRTENVEMDDKLGPVFRFKSDAAKVERWAKRIIARICSELLTNDNSIKQEFLDLVNKTKDSLSARDLICGYFSIVNQYMTNLITQSDDASYINMSVFKTYIQYVNQYSKWVWAVLLDRAADPNVTYKDEKTQISADDGNFDIKLGIISGVVGTLFMVGLASGIAAYNAYQSRKNNNSNSAEETPDNDNPPPPGWHMI